MTNVRSIFVALIVCFFASHGAVGEKASCGPRYQLAAVCNHKAKFKNGTKWVDVPGELSNEFTCSHVPTLCNQAYGKECFGSANVFETNYDIDKWCKPTQNCDYKPPQGAQVWECFGCDAFEPPQQPCPTPAPVDPYCRPYARRVMIPQSAYYHAQFYDNTKNLYATLYNNTMGNYTATALCKQAYPSVASCLDSVAYLEPQWMDAACLKSMPEGAACSEDVLAEVYVCTDSEKRSACRLPQEHCPNATPPEEKQCANDCNGNGVCILGKCQCLPTYTGDTCDQRTDKFQQCFSLPDGAPFSGDVCVEAKFMDCGVDLSVKIGPLSVWHKQYSVLDLKRLIHDELGNPNERPLGFCQNLLGCNACLNFTLEVDSKHAKGCGVAQVDCGKLFHIGQELDCWESTQLGGECFSACSPPDCSQHGTCENGFCTCDGDHGGFGCEWECPMRCHEKQHQGQCTANACVCANSTTQAGYQWSGASCDKLQPYVPPSQNSSTPSSACIKGTLNCECLPSTPSCLSTKLWCSKCAELTSNSTCITRCLSTEHQSCTPGMEHCSCDAKQRCSSLVLRCESGVCTKIGNKGAQDGEMGDVIVYLLIAGGVLLTIVLVVILVLLVKKVNGNKAQTAYGKLGESLVDDDDVNDEVDELYM